MSVAINAKIDYPRSIEIIEPDCLYSYGAPDDDFVMSRDCNNKVVSKYGDDVWDFWPYNTISSSPRRFIFSSLNAGKKDKNTIVLRKQIKSIAFAILYGATRIRSISSIFAYLNPLRSFANGLAELNTNFETATYSQKLKAISKICCKSKSYKDSVMGCTYMLINEIDPNLIGFDIFPANERSNLVNALLEIKPTSETKQTDIIPSRIYSELIVGVEQFINDVDVVLPKFCEFVGKINTVTGYGLAYDARIRKFKAIDIKPQLLDIKKRNGDVVKSWRYPYVPDFSQGAKEHGLNELFEKYGVKSVTNLLRFLCDIQRAILMHLGIFTGARLGELTLMPYKCVSEAKFDGTTSYIISGYSSKLSGGTREVDWVGCQVLEKSVYVAQRLADLLIELVCHNQLSDDQKPLFPVLQEISGTYSRLEKTLQNSLYDLPVSLSFGNANSLKSFIKIFGDKIKITQEDLDELIYACPEYDYLSDKNYEVGNFWPIAPHQLRRSLVAYAFNDGIDHPALKYQLKHIYTAMILHYGKNGMFLTSMTEGADHIANDFREAMEQYEIKQYFIHVLENDNTLHGAHGTAIQQIKIRGDIDKTRKQAKSGQVRYTETPVGGCASPSGCTMGAMIDVTDCIECKHGVRDIGDLPKVKKAIQHIQILNDKYPEGSQEHDSSAEQLSLLHKVKIELENDGKEGVKV